MPIKPYGLHTKSVVIGYVRHYLAVIITATHILLVGDGREGKTIVK